MELEVGEGQAEREAPRRSAGAVFRNAKALLALQVANYVFPFVLLPYLTRTLGAELYGVVAYGLSIAQIAFVITDYGFALSATYLIAKARDDASYVRKVVGSAFLVKALLLLLVVAALGVYLAVDTKYAMHHGYLLLMLLMIVGQAYQPIWFFQGMERMGSITAYMLVSKVAYLGLVILWVRQASDYHWVAIANGVSNLAAAGIGIGMMARMGYRPAWPGLRFLRETLAHSTEFFWSRAAVSVYTSGGAFFLGLVSTPVQVAYYAAAEQLYRGGQSLMAPLTQALYPHMAKHRNYPLLFRFLRLSGLVTGLAVVTGFVAGPWLIQGFFGEHFKESYPVLMVFLVTLAVTTPSVLLGYPFLGALGVPSLANRSVMYGGALQVGLLLLSYAMHWRSAVWVSVTVLVTESLVLALRVRWGAKHFALQRSAAAAPHGGAAPSAPPAR